MVAAGGAAQKRDVLGLVSFQQRCVKFVQHRVYIGKIVLRHQWVVRQHHIPSGQLGQRELLLCLARLGIFQHTAAHHINAYFLRGLFVPNKQYRLAAERLRCNGKFRVLHCRDLGHRSGRFKGLLQFAVGLRHDLLEIEQPCRLF